jgi:uncharacterized protein DUF5522/cysteine-rich CWC protein
MSSVEQKNCSSCEEGFTCGAKADDERCWCDALPHLPLTAIEASDCLCPKCLSDTIQSLDSSRTQTEEHVRDAMGTGVDPQSLPIEGEDYYSEGGAIVFTARYHLRRGYCCDSGCRHCPYESRSREQASEQVSQS